MSPDIWKTLNPGLNTLVIPEDTPVSSPGPSTLKLGETMRQILASYVMLHYEINDVWETSMECSSTKQLARQLTLAQLILCFVSEQPYISRTFVLTWNWSWKPKQKQWRTSSLWSINRMPTSLKWRLPSPYPSNHQTISMKTVFSVVNQQVQQQYVESIFHVVKYNYRLPFPWSNKK